MKKLSEILSSPVVTVVGDNKISCHIKGEKRPVDRIVKSTYFSNWPIDRIRYRNEWYLIDSAVDVHNPIQY